MKNAEIHLEDNLLSPEEGGELSDESAEHRLGAIFAARYYGQQGYDITLYGDINDEQNKTDVFARATKNSPTDTNKVVEVEIIPEHIGHIHEEYEALKQAYGDVVWVVENFEEAKTLFEKLSEKVEGLPSGWIRNIETVNEQIDDPGNSEIHTLNLLRRELE